MLVLAQLLIGSTVLKILMKQVDDDGGVVLMVDTENAFAAAAAVILSDNLVESGDIYWGTGAVLVTF